MAIDKEKLALGSTAAIVGALVPALISLNIFATKTDVAELKTYMAEKYVQKSEVHEKLEKIEKVLDWLRDNIVITKRIP